MVLAVEKVRAAENVRQEAMQRARKLAEEEEQLLAQAMSSVQHI
jgi:hypothetical protein